MIVPISYHLCLPLLWAFAEGAIAGGAASLVVEAALYPIDTIKTRLQVAFICRGYFQLESEYLLGS